MSRGSPTRTLRRLELIYRQGPWRSLEDVELATLTYIDWFNHRRILEPIGDIPPAEYEANYYRQQSTSCEAETHTREPA